MGCASSTHTQDDQIVSKKVRLPPHWSSQTPLSLQQLERQRDEFWDTRVEGQQLIWETLKAAVEASWTNLELANTIVESAGIIVASNSGDLSLCYDERGGKYEIPVYALRDPSNLVR
eukprot:TRINITY_DN16268_c0_g1::TRINITY_DN16268_c0_g1_i1::g.3112::m.3112 TRINITY_DN16268_c0_g1::TRINITY_DN16268_c0_g1_i1::g.3112  ORF type:complete len:117 (+),score=4.08,sp/Q6DG43/UBTD2_DANRE/44.44/4e-19 TRINITY_DN16268_c0_g1_i1:166-516(+)